MFKKRHDMPLILFEVGPWRLYSWPVNVEDGWRVACQLSVLPSLFCRHANSHNELAHGVPLPVPFIVESTPNDDRAEPTRLAHVLRSHCVLVQHGL